MNTHIDVKKVHDVAHVVGLAGKIGEVSSFSIDDESVPVNS